MPSVSKEINNLIKDNIVYNPVLQEVVARYMNSNEIHVPINGLSNSDETMMKLSDYIYTEYQELKIEIDYVKTIANRNKDGSIGSIFAYIKGIRNCDNNVVCLPNGNLLNKYDLFDVLQIKANYNILNNRRRASFSKGDVLPYRVLSFENNVMKIEVDVSKYVNNKLRGIYLIDISSSKCFLKLNFALKDKDISSFSKINVSELQTLSLTVGKKYTLVLEGEENFQNIERTYIIVKKIEELNNVKMDAVVVKQIDGVETTIFSLTKNDCKVLGIKYIPGLQMFPSNMDWKPLDKKEESTQQMSVKNIDQSLYNLYYNDFIFNSGMKRVQITPVSSKIVEIVEDNHQIDSIIIEVDGFKMYNDDVIITPLQQKIHIEDFLRTLKVITKNQIGPNSSIFDLQYLSFAANEEIPFRIITQKYSLHLTNCKGICDNDDKIYIEVDLTKPNKKGISILYEIDVNNFIVSWLYKTRNKKTLPTWQY